MLLKSLYLESRIRPEVWDRLSAARFTSGFCALAAMSFFVTPVTFFGVSEQPYGTNAWLAGGLILVLALTRTLFPGGSTIASWSNAVLGVWVIVSPWIFSYTDNLPLTVNSVGAGAAIIGLSLFSASFTRGLRAYDYKSDY
jgi:hypothetical protein